MGYGYGLGVYRSDYEDYEEPDGPRVIGRKQVESIRRTRTCVSCRESIPQGHAAIRLAFRDEADGDINNFHIYNEYAHTSCADLIK